MLKYAGQDGLYLPTFYQEIVTVYKFNLLCSSYIYLANTKITAGKLGAVEMLLKTMTEHIDNLELCAFGCEALSNITHGNSKKTIETNPKH